MLSKAKKAFGKKEEEEGKYCWRANRVFNASRKQQIWGKKSSRRRRRVSFPERTKAVVSLLNMNGPGHVEPKALKKWK